VNAFAGIFSYFGKLLVAMGTAFLCWFILTEWESVNEKIYSPILPTVACFLIGYILAVLFLAVYDLACSAILQCFLVDEEVSKGLGKHRPKEFEQLIKSTKPLDKKV